MGRDSRERCSRCGQDAAVESHFTTIGILLCLATFWLCCVGLVCLFQSRTDHCVYCHNDWSAARAANGGRTKKLHIFDPMPAELPGELTADPDAKPPKPKTN
ncbi:unnamed protein product, partial [Mesorhabditis spiculigera]